MHCRNDGGETVVEQHDLGRFARHVGAALSHRHANGGSFERRCVIDAIARHCNEVPTVLQRSNDADLLFGVDACVDTHFFDMPRQFVVGQLRQFAARQ